MPARETSDTKTGGGQVDWQVETSADIFCPGCSYNLRGAVSTIVNRQSAIDTVRARMGSGTSARELRIGRLDSTLTVLPT